MSTWDRILIVVGAIAWPVALYCKGVLLFDSAYWTLGAIGIIAFSVFLLMENNKGEEG